MQLDLVKDKEEQVDLPYAFEGHSRRDLDHRFQLVDPKKR